MAFCIYSICEEKWPGYEVTFFTDREETNCPGYEVEGSSRWQKNSWDSTSMTIYNDFCVRHSIIFKNHSTVDDDLNIWAWKVIRHTFRTHWVAGEIHWVRLQYFKRINFCHLPIFHGDLISHIEHFCIEFWFFERILFREILFTRKFVPLIPPPPP